MRAFLVLPLAAACGQAPCPTGFVLRGDYCLSESAPAESEYLYQGDTTPNVPTVVGGEDTPRARMSFGDPCSDDDECLFPADLCLRAPGSSEGYCTASGCEADVAACPAGWTCTETTSGDPWVCVAP